MKITDNDDDDDNGGDDKRGRSDADADKGIGFAWLRFCGLLSSESNRGKKKRKRRTSKPDEHLKHAFSLDM